MDIANFDRRKGINMAAKPNTATDNLQSYRISWLARILDSNAFELVVGSIIAVNAVSLALLTLTSEGSSTANVLIQIDALCLGFFLVELIFRLASYGRKPWKFFAKGWNVFDFLVVGLAPFFAGQSTALRLLRLFRLLRIFRFLPELRLLTTSIFRSIPPLASLGLLVAMFVFLYGMTGTYLFGDQLPEAWGDILVSMSTLFVMLTLENFPDNYVAASAISPFGFVFFASFVFFIVFTVLNVLIGIVLNAMDEARESQKSKDEKLSQLDSLLSTLEQSLKDNRLSNKELEELNKQIREIRQREASQKK